MSFWRIGENELFVEPGSLDSFTEFKNYKITDIKKNKIQKKKLEFFS